MIEKIRSYISLSRAHFLPMTMLPYALGIGVLQHEDVALDMALVWWGVLIQALAQLSVSFLNDYWDVETDRINTNRTIFSGGSGELATGAFPRWVGLMSGIIYQVAAIVLALLVGIPAESWLVLILAIFVAHFYTAPPLKLVYRGLGEFTTAASAAFIVPQWAYTLQAGAFSLETFLLGLPILPFTMGMMLGIATPDYNADSQVNKRTLAVIVGQKNIATLYSVLIIAGYVSFVVIGLSFTELTLPIGIILLNVPLAIWAWYGLRTPEKNSEWEWTFMIFRPALLAATVVVIVVIGSWV